MATGKIQTSYSSIAHREIPEIFFKRFLSIIKKNLEKFFGEEEAKRVLRALGTGQLRIISPENFLYSPLDINDKSLEIYNQSNSIEEFFYKSLISFKERAENGETDIEIREFFFAFIDLISSKDILFSEDDINKYLKILLATCINTKHKSPFVFQIFEPHLSNFIQTKTSLNLRNQGIFIRAFFKAFQEFTKGEFPIAHSHLFFPKIEFIYPVYHEVRENQEQYLASLFGVAKSHIKAIFKNVEDLSEESLSFDTAFEILESEIQKTYNKASVLLELQKIKDENPFKTYPTMREFSDTYKGQGIPKAVLNDSRISQVCVNQELLEQCIRPYFCNIEINCIDLEMKGINMYIDAAKTLSLLKTYYFAHVKKKEARKRTPYYKITLINVKELNQEFIDFLKKKQRQLRSITGREFIFDVRYFSKTISKKLGKTSEPYIRIISDIHADYNKNNNYAYNFGNDFIINCGDTAGDANTCINWITNHMKQGVVVAGNHLGYSPVSYETSMKNTKSYQLHLLGINLAGRAGHPLFLSNSVTEHEGLVILGTTLYTDFALYGKDNIEEAMQYAKKCMNDFRYITTPGHRDYTLTPEGTWKVKKIPRGEGVIRGFTPQDHAYYFNFSYNFLKEKVLEYSNRSIIIVTHHAPSPYSISPEYAGSMLNPAFASNLNEFIVKHPQIRLWCHGHVHSNFDYILGQTRVVCCPFGYNNENNADLPFNYGKRIKVRDIKNKYRPWTEICKKEIQQGLIKVYEK